MTVADERICCRCPAIRCHDKNRERHTAHIIILTWLPLMFRALQWPHNEHHGVSNHWFLDGLLNHLFWRTSKKTSKLRVTGLCGLPLDSPHKGPVTRNMFPFDDVIMGVILDIPHGFAVTARDCAMESCNRVVLFIGWVCVIIPTR